MKRRQILTLVLFPRERTLTHTEAWIRRKNTKPWQRYGEVNKKLHFNFRGLTSPLITFKTGMPEIFSDKNSSQIFSGRSMTTLIPVFSF